MHDTPGVVGPGWLNLMPFTSRVRAENTTYRRRQKVGNAMVRKIKIHYLLEAGKCRSKREPT